MAPDSPRLHVQPRDRQVRMAWRNGGGETRELYAWPRGAGLDAFDWRVSVATIGRSGPFSRYPGVLRTAVLIDGAGFRLVADGAMIELAGRFAQATFAGAPTWQCDLMEGPVQVFNVMVRAASAAPVAVVCGASRAIEPAPCRVAYAARGSSGLRIGDDIVPLCEGDACAIEEAGLALLVQPTRDACVLVASMSAVGGA